MDCILKAIVVFAVMDISSAQWGYTQDEIDVFDLADEFKANFYEFLGVSQDAALSDIRRSYRKLSLTMHPDKNKTEGAEENFVRLVAVYEILKNKEKRAIYDNVLVEGIPSAYLYVPKQLRKMSLTEVSVIIALIFTCGHYLFMWGSYAEKRLVLEEILPRIRKKKLKGKKKADTKEVEELDKLPDQMLQKPRLIDLLPILIVRNLYKFYKFLPEYIRQTREEAKRLKEEEAQRKLEEEEAERKYEEELVKREERKIHRKVKMKEKREEMLKFVETSLGDQRFSPFDEPINTLEDLEDLYDDELMAQGKKKKKKKHGWTVEEESFLVKLMTKYPAGSSQRWQLIADEMGIETSDIIVKSKQIKSDLGKSNTSAKQQLKPKKEASVPDIATVRHPESAERDEEWSQTQQKLLESALQQFPKGTSERWEKIAKCVPEKTKDECVTRYRYLAEKVKQKKKQRI